MRIAIAGQIRSGKNTLAEYFEGMGFEPFAFAEGISHVIDMYFPEAREEGKPRKHYQVIGQSFRQLNPDIWVEWTDRELQKYYKWYAHPDNANVVITDLRQPNEYKYLKENGFTVIKVESHFELRKERAANSGDSFGPETWFHETESHIAEMPCDYLVTNNDTIESLHEQADFILSEVIKSANR